MVASGGGDDTAYMWRVRTLNDFCHNFGNCKPLWYGIGSLVLQAAALSVSRWGKTAFTLSKVIQTQ